MEKDDTVGKLEDEQASSTFKLSHIEESKSEPLTYTVFGVRTVRKLNNEHETDQSACRGVSRPPGEYGSFGGEPKRPADWGLLVQAD